ncbi:hypothetical protein [Spirochaeta cellobiosiphila]|uniref:hypothetical protein n=1 Tax=Spirochaeta cellobiosiphila TaxID=504483 RepID=UPI000400B416|nr:hypothetical protein [Spirochaeta cellobiosiphila]
MAQEDNSQEPVLYSKNVIRIFSSVFTCILGGMLLRSNLLRLGKTREASNVIIFAFLYTSLVFVGVNMFLSIIGSTPRISINIVFAIIGTFIQEALFYKPHMPEEYTPRSIVWPVIIGIILFLIAIFFRAYATFIG